MKLSKAIKPLSYVKAHASEIINNFEKDESSSPVVITQNGEAKAVMLSIKEYEDMQESLAMLQLINMGLHDIQKGDVRPASEVFEELRQRRWEK